MKLRPILLLLITIPAFSVAGLKAQDNKTDQSSRDWYNCSFDREGVYGAEVNKAYEFLAGKKLKKTPVIAFICNGMDIEHEELSHAVWTNPKEKDNGKDNDRNGLAGDLHGWNFIGGANGDVIVRGPNYGDLEYYRLRDKYITLYRRDGQFQRMEIGPGITDVKLVPADAPENIDEYDYFLKISANDRSPLMNRHKGYQFSLVYEDYLNKFNDNILKMYPGKELVTFNDFKVMVNDPAYVDLDDEWARIAAFYMGVSLQMAPNKDNWHGMYAAYDRNEFVKSSYDSYQQLLKRVDFDVRNRIVGDDPYDLNDRVYGNNSLLTANCAVNVLKAGVIFSKRNNGIGGDGIADFAKLMTLVAYPEQSSPYTKDLVLGIRYAVDHGADVIVMSYQQPGIYSEGDRKWMYDALRYAEDKGVLVIFPVWENSADLDKYDYFPNRFMGERELTNLLIVGPSDKQGAPTVKSNYGEKGLDLFAPSVNIYSTMTGDIYNNATSVQLGAGIAAGVAALVKGYYPTLNGSQIRTLLMETVTPREGAEVEKEHIVNGRLANDIFLFEELSGSGGIINAYNAVRAAEQATGKK